MSSELSHKRSLSSTGSDDDYASTAATSVGSKKAKITTADGIRALKPTQLAACDKEELIRYIGILTKTTGPAPQVGVALSKEQTTAKVQQARQLMVKGIISQMKWKPSCKHGSAKFSYSSSAASADIIRQLLQIPDKKKTAKHTIAEFEDKVAKTTVTAGIRYGYLQLKSVNINCRFTDELEFTVSGGYGL